MVVVVVRVRASRVFRVVIAVIVRGVVAVLVVTVVVVTVIVVTVIAMIVVRVVVTVIVGVAVIVIVGVSVRHGRQCAPNGGLRGAPSSSALRVSQRRPGLPRDQRSSSVVRSATCSASSAASSA